MLTYFHWLVCQPGMIAELEGRTNCDCKIDSNQYKFHCCRCVLKDIYPVSNILILASKIKKISI